MRSSTVFILVTVSVALALNFAMATDHGENLTMTEDEVKIISDCQHPDYRSYIKCLKRHKRHHSLPAPVKICLEECFDSHCSTLKCSEDCHTKCKRKVRVEENYSRTIEADPECNHNDCGNKPVVHNIDTTVNVDNNFGKNISSIIKELRPSIEITNVINGADGKKCSGNNCCSGSGCCNGTDGTGNGCCSGNGCCNGNNCYNGPNIFSFSMSMAGFKTWPMIFPPMMPVPVPNPSSKVDCSFCGNILFRFRCDKSCLNANETEVSDIDRRFVAPSKCKSPNCIGGT